ncbi:acyl-CoA-binding domain-containing protein 6 isoform X1 [Kryptolebias marmoratus]|uniref:Acyl-CoA binding domain containing 6 n=1 Tax=Kryptolebias marmoratus TaxID=37003 RepID=A0A3Q3H3F6_KRYMA|nr:acyl-CoA-binding domain-containing protein 6 isoform X1 [Kryptolebias marmoratus]
MASGSPSSSPDTATGSGTDPARPDTGEPLGGAGSDSDSDLGLSKFDCSAMDMGDQLEGDELEREFESAADRVRDLIQTASRDQLLYLYARYKQVKVGKCNTSKPGFFDFEGQRKWQAWKQLGDMDAEQAMREYISCVNVLDPEGSTKERRGAERRTGFGGAAVSSLYQEEMIREEDKNIFDYCRENNIENVRKAISSQKVDVNTKDEELCVLNSRGQRRSFTSAGSLTCFCSSKRQSERCPYSAGLQPNHHLSLKSKCALDFQHMKLLINLSFPVFSLLLYKPLSPLNHLYPDVTNFFYIINISLPFLTESRGKNEGAKTIQYYFYT